MWAIRWRRCWRHGVIDGHCLFSVPVTFRNQAKQFTLQTSPFQECLHGLNLAMRSPAGSMGLTAD
jgi:hypothetical protein